MTTIYEEIEAGLLSMPDLISDIDGVVLGLQMGSSLLNAVPDVDKRDVFLRLAMVCVVGVLMLDEVTAQGEEAETPVSFGTVPADTPMEPPGPHHPEPVETDPSCGQRDGPAA